MGYSAKALTDSPFQISLVSVAYFTPMFVLALPSGVLADAADRKKTVMVCRAASAVVALGAGRPDASATPWGTSLCWCCASSPAPRWSLEIAARQAFVTQVVRPDQVAGATALGSVQGGVARVLGPADRRRADRARR